MPKTPPAKGLVVYWFPASNDEMKKSSLRDSRTLSLYASQCISMELADTQLPNADKLLGEAKLPVAVIATPDGTPVTRKLKTKTASSKLRHSRRLLTLKLRRARPLSTGN